MDSGDSQDHSQTEAQPTRSGARNIERESIMKKKEYDIVMQAYEKIMKAYSENLGSDGIPENDYISGNLAEAIAILDRVI